MTSVFPGTTIDSFATLTDGVTTVLAAHQNDRAAAIVTVQTKVGVDADTRSASSVEGRLKDLDAAFTVASTAPSSPQTGDRWLDTSGTPYLLKVWNGATWQTVGATGATARTVYDDNSGTSYPAVDGMTIPDADIVVLDCTGNPTLNGLAAAASPRAPTTLWCLSGTLTVRAAGNLYIADNLDVLIPQNGSITLAADNFGDWFEVARSATAPSGGALQVEHGGVQSLTTSTLTTLAWNTENSKTWAGMHDNTTNNGRLIALSAGLYHIWCQMAFANNTTGSRRLEAWVNGTTTQVAVDERPAATGTIHTSLQISRDVRLSAGQYIEFQGWQDSGGGLQVSIVGHASPQAGLRWVGP